MAMPEPTKFIVSHPERYMGPLGKGYITARSGWERAFFSFLDAPKMPMIAGWCSECLSIPYINPLTNRVSSYVPDLMIAYTDKNGKHHVEVIEIKPAKEVPGARTAKMTAKLAAIQAINAAKWAAAVKFCRKQGWKFRVCTEKDLFALPKRAK